MDQILSPHPALMVALGPQLKAPSWQIGRKYGTGNPRPDVRRSGSPHACEVGEVAGLHEIDLAAQCSGERLQGLVGTSARRPPRAQRLCRALQVLSRAFASSIWACGWRALDRSPLS